MAKHHNPYLKVAHQEHEYSLDHIKELQRCSTDPIYFIKTYCQIQHPTYGSIPFSLYPYQEDMIRAYQENRQVVVLSARQTGKCFFSATEEKVVDLSRVENYTIKKLVLWIINRRVYNELFKKVQIM
jgi:hypothetical protein